VEPGCYYSLGDMEKAQNLLDAIPDLINKKKISGKDLPTEVFIKKKRMCFPFFPSRSSFFEDCFDFPVAFYKEKQTRRTGSEKNCIEAVKISPAEGL
jgi:hypothetical protein